MRKMPKFGDVVVAWYLQVAVTITMAGLMFALGESFTIFAKFDWQAWVLIVLAAATSVYSEAIRFKAFKLQKAAPLQKLVPLTTLFQWIFDVALFHIAYTGW